MAGDERLASSSSPRPKTLFRDVREVDQNAEPVAGANEFEPASVRPGPYRRHRVGEGNAMTEHLWRLHTGRGASPAAWESLERRESGPIASQPSISGRQQTSCRPLPRISSTNGKAARARAVELNAYVCELHGGRERRQVVERPPWASLMAILIRRLSTNRRMGRNRTEGRLRDRCPGRAPIDVALIGAFRKTRHRVGTARACCKGAKAHRYGRRKPPAFPNFPSLSGRSDGTSPPRVRTETKGDAIETDCAFQRISGNFSE